MACCFCALAWVTSLRLVWGRRPGGMGVSALDPGVYYFAAQCVYRFNKNRQDGLMFGASFYRDTEARR